MRNLSILGIIVCILYFTLIFISVNFYGLSFHDAANDNLIINYTGQNTLSIFDFAMLVAKTFNFDSSLVNKCKTDDLNFKAKRPINVSLSTDFVSDLINCNIYETEYCLNIIKDKIK